MADLPFHKTDPAHASFQFLEDLACAYWFSETLFTALMLRLFEAIDQHQPSTEKLADCIGCDPGKLHRMLRALEQMKLIGMADGYWCNSQLANLYLLPAKDSYLGDFLLYRKNMQPGWQSLPVGLVGQSSVSEETIEQKELERRTFHYVRATDQLMRHKATEITALLHPNSWHGRLLDIGCGGGSLCRALLKAGMAFASAECPGADCIELPEVLKAAHRIYPSREDWQNITPVADDFRTYTTSKKYGLILLSNFLHAYGPDEAQILLTKAINLLAPDGMLLIHDYFPDRHTISPAKGPLYDLAMMQNTYNGCCHTTADIQNWLMNNTMPAGIIRDLTTDSSVLFVSRNRQSTTALFSSAPGRNLEDWPYIARNHGFEQATLLPAKKIITAPWVRLKCQHGCERYGIGLQCPPHGLDHQQTREMLADYSWAMVIAGMPPGKEFHNNILALEKKAFLSGYHKAFGFIAGHCPICDQCPADGKCRFPDKARPSMEGSGMDVYETARRAGIPLEPVREKIQYVKYIGLLLLE